MTIRFRILLVALVAVLAVSGAFYREYALGRTRGTALEAEQSRVSESLALSFLVHELQRERGLTAGSLANPSAEARAAREDQRRQTDAALAAAALPPLDTAEALAQIRRRVDAGQDDWPETRSGYNGLINALLDAMALRGRASEAILGGSPLRPLADLAVARENLGLARATLNRIYARGRAEPAEITDLAGYYGAYTENLRTFVRDADAAGRARLDQVPATLRFRVLREIEGVLIRGGIGRGQTPQARRWWSDATELIDGYKGVEESAYRAYLDQNRAAIERQRGELLRYGAAAVTVSLLVGLLALFAVVRILSALGILLRALRDVVDREDFGVRIQLGRRDEFGRIGASINALLEYTDTLIRQKEHLASTDLLTQLSNRRHFIELADKELRRADRDGDPVALVLSDLDHFKEVNDRFGHGRGDQVLHGFASVLNGQRRASDLVGRWGGEEFVLLLPGTGEGQARGLVERLRREMEGVDFGTGLKVTASFGVTFYRRGESLEELVRRADRALYRAKSEGRDRAVFE